MAEDGTEQKKKTLVGRIALPAIILFVTGAAGFAATYLGVADAIFADRADAKDLPAFVELEPMTVSVVSAKANRQLRVKAALEVEPEYYSEVDAMRPRIADVMITYLNSIEMEDIENPSALIALRSQIRRRIDLVLGGDRVRDLLVQEFVIN